MVRVVRDVKSVILEQPSTIINLFLTIQNAIIHVFDDEPSEIDIFRSRKQKELTLAEMIDYFNSQISDEHCNVKSIDYDTIKLFRDLINRTKLVEIIEIDKDSDTQTDSEDYFDKVFNSFSNDKPKKSKVKL